jgi:hypothetical protein
MPPAKGVVFGIAAWLGMMIVMPMAGVGPLA